jgi:hypothetical protein
MTKITDYVTKAIALLVEQFRNLSRIPGVFSAVAQQCQDLENTLFDLVQYRGLSTSTGVQLDRIGTILGLLRTSVDDEQYRSDLYFQAAINNSKGTPEEMIVVLKRVTGLTRVDFIEVQPATIIVSLLDPPYVPVGLRTNMNKIKPGGVALYITRGSSRPFCFSLNGTTPFYSFGKGFGNNSTDINGGQLSIPI